MEYKLSDYIALNNKIKNEPLIDADRIKIYILRSYTCETLSPMLNVMLNKKSYIGEILLGGFNQFYQEALDPASGLYKFSPDFVLFMVRPEDFYEPIFDNYYDEADNIDLHIQKILDDLKMLILKIKQRLNTNIIISNFLKPYFAPDGIYHSQYPDGISGIIMRLNIGLSEIARDVPGTFILDVCGAASALGINNILDLKMYAIAKNPYTPEFYEYLSGRLVKYIEAVLGKRKKCIVLDLDNTLWKGIVGEDDPSGIKIYKDFQRQLLFLNKTGILLAVNSKNNYEDGISVIRSHDEMILREDNFSAIKINWNDKAANIREIAEELNIGLDSMVFIDDNPLECELINRLLPEVYTLRLPEDPLKYVEALRDVPLLDHLLLTPEDIKKPAMYKEQRQREALKTESADLFFYYKELQMEAYVYLNDEFLIPRIAQLTQKTNQFNLTTRRYTEEQIREILCENHKIYALSLKDKFGDYGVVGVIIIEDDGKAWRIDTFLLSCRVLGRTVENAFLGYVINEAAIAGATEITGEYIPTQKNAPVKDLYPDMGFCGVDENRYSLSLNGSTGEAQGTVLCVVPEYITIDRRGNHNA